MAWSPRPAARIGALVALPVLVVLTGSPASADVPVSWPEPEPMSTLFAIGLFAGVPAGLFAVITLLVMAPSLRAGSGYRPGLPWYAEPVQFGELPAATSEASAVEAGTGSQVDTQGGGAHGRW